LRYSLATLIASTLLGFAPPLATGSIALTLLSRLELGAGWSRWISGGFRILSVDPVGINERDDGRIEEAIDPSRGLDVCPEEQNGEDFPA
jgi:hypothetical protein